ncbi:MAG: HAD family phosphatase [Sphingomonas sp.]|uniref:Cof-type HAD-IIB family hydrolase n=1 Tax=Sphingomonas sp. TaxID=28214 RepID=UPI001AD50139|nr:Cof-type HAD-IIB family hydrolase [Sphingomonas sp.]MBN8807296.1 HAD family phosphatase [Sphingomonas sp.]
MTIRLVVSDVDGTLVRKDKSLSPQTIAAVHRLRAANVPFTLISARPASGVLPLVAPLSIDLPLAAFNGGVLFRPDGSEIASHPIERAVVEGMFALADGVAVDRWVFADGQWFASTDQGDHVAHERIASNQAPVVRRDFTDLYDRADKITFVSDDRPLLRDLAERAGAAYGDRATIAQSQVYYLDVTGKAANKGDGVAALADLLGIALADTVVLGDMDNDLPMFARAGLAVAMGQAPDAVKAKADFVSSSNDEDGVARAIDTYILPKVTP